MSKQENERKRAQQRAIAQAQAIIAARNQIAAAKSALNPENSLAAPELALSMGSKAIAEPVAGLAGVGKLITSGGDVNQATETINSTRDMLTYEPRIEGTKRAEAAIQGGMQKALGGYMNWTEEHADKVAETWPSLAAAEKAILQTIPFFFARAGRIGSFFKRRSTYDPVRQAKDAGFIIAPSTVAGGSKVGSPFKRAAEVAGGKARTESKIIGKNQLLANDLVAKEIGLPKGTPITRSSLNQLKKPYQAVYQRIRNIKDQFGIDDQFKMDLNDIRSELISEFTGKTKHKSVDNFFKGLTTDRQLTPGGVLDQIKQLRREADDLYRKESSPNGITPKQRQLAYAKKQAAVALEDMLERRVTMLVGKRGRNKTWGGRDNLVDDYRRSRLELAKIRNVENALVGTDVIAGKLLQERGRGGILTGNLGLLADVAENFPNALKYSANLGKTGELGELDVILGAAGASSLVGGAGATQAWMTGWPGLRMAGSSLAARAPKKHGSLAELLLRGEAFGSQGYGKNKK